MNNTTVINWIPFTEETVPEQNEDIMISYKINGVYKFGFGSWHPRGMNGIYLRSLGGSVYLQGPHNESDRILILGWADIPDSYHPAIEFAPPRDNIIGVIYFTDKSSCFIARYKTVDNYVVITDSKGIKYRVNRYGYCDAKFGIMNEVPYDFGPEGMGKAIVIIDADNIIDHITLYQDDAEVIDV